MRQKEEEKYQESPRAGILISGRDAQSLKAQHAGHRRRGGGNMFTMSQTQDKIGRRVEMGGKTEFKKKEEEEEEGSGRGRYSPSGSKRVQLKRKQGVWWTAGVLDCVHRASDSPLLCTTTSTTAAAASFVARG